MAQLKPSEKILYPSLVGAASYARVLGPAAENLRRQQGILKHHESREIFLTCDFLLFCSVTGVILEIELFSHNKQVPHSTNVLNSVLC